MHDIADRIRDLVRANPKRAASIVEYGKDRSMLDWLGDNAPEPIRGDGYTTATRLYWVVNGMTDFPRCTRCGERFGQGKNVRVTSGYGDLCPKCRAHDSLEKRERTCLEKYGVRNPGMSDDMKAKIRAINIEKFGSACALSNPDIRKKADRTILERYGTEHYQSTDEFKRRVKDTCLERYGVDSPMKSKTVRAKAAETTFRKYGVEFASQSPEFQERRHRHLVELYGEDYGKAIYGGHGNPGQCRRAYGYMLSSQTVEPTFTVDEYVAGKAEDVRREFPFRCRKCGTVFMSWWDNGHSRACPKCFANRSTSDMENDFADFVRSVSTHHVDTSVRDLIPPLELDLVVREAGLAFEFDGLYWHSDLFHMGRSYHLAKTESCAAAGIRLVHVFEDEWTDHRDIVESRVSDMFGKYVRTVYARECSVVVPGPDDVREFLDRNHLQGFVRSPVAYSLVHDGETVSMMTFGKSRFNSNYDWEMLRFCNRLGHHVPGAASRLLRHFEIDHGPKSLLSYADRRWSDGKLYRVLGFDFVSKTVPNYWYIAKGTACRLSRLGFQKHLLKDRLKEFDPSLSEAENMRKNGYSRIYDCGNLVFAKRY